MYLGASLLAFTNLSVLNWEFYAICIPTIILETLDNQKDERNSISN